MRFRIFHWIRIFIWFRKNLNRKKLASRNSAYPLGTIRISGCLCKNFYFWAWNITWPTSTNWTEVTVISILSWLYISWLHNLKLFLMTLLNHTCLTTYCINFLLIAWRDFQTLFYWSIKNSSFQPYQKWLLRKKWSHWGMSHAAWLM